MKAIRDIIRHILICIRRPACYRAAIAMLLVAVMLTTNVFSLPGLNTGGSLFAAETDESAEQNEEASLAAVQPEDDTQADAPDDASQEEGQSQEQVSQPAEESTEPDPAPAEESTVVQNNGSGSADAVSEDRDDTSTDDIKTPAEESDNKHQKDEATTSSSTESKENTEPEEYELIYKAADHSYKITVRGDKFSGLARARKMRVAEVSKKSELYDNIMNKLNKSLDSNSEGQIKDLRLYDIIFTDENGKLVRLRNDVEVKISYKKSKAPKVVDKDQVRAFTAATVTRIASESSDTEGLYRGLWQDLGLMLTSKAGTIVYKTLAKRPEWAAEEDTVVELKDTAAGKVVSEVTYMLDKEDVTGIAVIGKDALAEARKQEKKADQNDRLKEDKPDQNAREDQQSQEQSSQSVDHPAQQEKATESTTEQKDLQKIQEEIRKDVFESSLTASGKDYKVTLTYDDKAKIPEGSKLTVREIADYSRSYKDYMSEAQSALSEEKKIDNARFFDINIWDAQGNKIEPAAPVNVTIEFDEMPAEDKSSLELIHFTESEDKKNQSTAVTPEIIDGVTVSDGNKEGTIDSLEFKTDGFSVYGILFTVDFHWGDYTYSIKGESEITLSELFAKLGITEIGISDVDKVSFSNPDLVKVEKKDGDWLLTSLKAFDSEEKLTLMLKNGESVEIKVTDDGEAGTDIASGVWPANSTGEGNNQGKWRIASDGTMTITGKGSMPDYNSATAAPWGAYDLRKQITKVVIEDGITYLGKNMLTRAWMTTIDASHCTTLTKTGGDLFKQSTYGGETGVPNKLVKVDFSNNTNFSSFGSNAFQYCSGIADLNISGTKLQNLSAFDASKTALVTLKANNCAQFTTNYFSGYSKLETIEMAGFTKSTIKLPTSVKNVNLANSTNLGITAINDLPASLITLNLANCTGLSGVLDLSEQTMLTSLDVSGCTGLTGLIIPASLTTLNVTGCTDLEYIYLPEGDPTSMPAIEGNWVSPLKMDVKLKEAGADTTVEGSEGVLLLNSAKQTELTADDIKELYIDLNEAAENTDSNSHYQYIGAKVADDEITKLVYDSAGNKWQYEKEDGSKVDITTNTCLSLSYFAKTLDLTIKWVEADKDGNLSALSPLYIDGSYPVDSDTWAGSDEIIDQYLRDHPSIPDTSLPLFIDKCFYCYLAIGSKDAETITDFGDYKDLQSFSLKNGSEGLLYRTD